MAAQTWVWLFGRLKMWLPPKVKGNMRGDDCDVECGCDCDDLVGGFNPFEK